MTIWRMCIECWIPKATNTHSKYVILIAFPWQQRLRERASVLRLFEYYLSGFKRSHHQAVQELHLSTTLLQPDKFVQINLKDPNSVCVGCVTKYTLCSTHVIIRFLNESIQ
jgi:hypothetical protein